MAEEPPRGAGGSDDDDRSGDDFRELLREFLAGNTDLDPSRLASAAGLPGDPELVSRLIGQLQQALQHSGEGIDWGLASEQAVQLASRSSVPSTPAERASLEQALHVAALWLDEATQITELTATPRLMSRTEWVRATMPVWTQLAEPVASSIATAMTDVFDQTRGELESEGDDLAGMLQNAGQVMRNVGGTLFAMQLGQVVGQLAAEVVSGGDVGVPLLPDSQAALLPQNLAAFGEGLEVDRQELTIYLAVRELAHARLFRHARWLRLQLTSAITDFARDLSIDVDRVQEFAADFDPSDTEKLREAF